MTQLTISGGRGAGKAVEGTAIVLPRAFTFFGGVDWQSGRLTFDDQQLSGMSIANKIFVFPTPSGGQGSAWKIGEMAANGCAPLALVLHRSNPVIVSGCIFSRVPLVADFAEDPASVFRLGDRLRVDPVKGTVELLERV